jgi:hemerythrin-like domain-containing protein
MDPIETLMQEHRTIERVIERLVDLAETAQHTGRLEGQPATDALEFIRHFADGCHHAKEEGHLFAMMVDLGFPKEQGPLAVMLYEHEQGRACVQTMVARLAAASDGEAAAVSDFAAAALAYADLLRGHIQKEDQVLYPMAVRAMSTADYQRLTLRFMAQDAEDQATGQPERCLSLAAQLTAGMASSPAQPATGDGCRGCSHACE